jgi:hypothetical protein
MCVHSGPIQELGAGASATYSESELSARVTVTENTVIHPNTVTERHISPI